MAAKVIEDGAVTCTRVICSCPKGRRWEQSITHLDTRVDIVVTDVTASSHTRRRRRSSLPSLAANIQRVSSFRSMLTGLLRVI